MGSLSAQNLPILLLEDKTIYDKDQMNLHKIILVKFGSFINSRTAIAGAIIGLLLVFFYNSKNLNCIGALSFLRSVHTFL